MDGQICYKMDFLCIRKKTLKIQITTLLCDSSSTASPCFFHVTLYSFRAPLSFFIFEY